MNGGEKQNDSELVRSGPGADRSLPMRGDRLADWLPAVAVAPFLILFLWTALARIGVPFELEWNEGHSAEQALRAARGLPLYPAPESGWVPYMYAPLYHLLYGWLMAVANNPSLGLGRLISLLGTLGTAFAIFAIVFERTRYAAPSAAAALLYFCFYRASGYWFDIARNDALAFGLCAWAMALTLRRKAKLPSVSAGFFLFVLAVFAKQTAGPVAVFCALWVFGRSLRRGNDLSPRIVLLLLGGVVLVTLNFWMLLRQSGNTHLWHYSIHNAIKHASDWSVLNWKDGTPPRVWSEGLRHVALLLLVILSWPCLLFFQKRKPRGVVYTIPFVLLGWASIAGFAKFGGYRNNFLPLFLMTSILFGIALAAWFRAFPASRRWIPAVAATVLLLLQAWQPWTAHGAFFNPGSQIPKSDSHNAYYRLMDWLREKQDRGERVWVVHHQWYGLLAGHEQTVNIDMLRCATWAGDPVPVFLYREIEEQAFDWIVLDRTSIESEWLAGSVGMALGQNYVPVGPLPIYRGLDSKALLPVTGAEMRPEFLYRPREKPE